MSTSAGRRVDKPWGHEEVWAEGPGYVGKLLIIRAGHRLSLQHHAQQVETIRVLSGELEISVGDHPERLQTERAGPGAPHGSITGFFTVLVEGEDMEDPVADTVRGIVDGHIVLSRKLGSMGHYPAIDVLQSVSRTMPSTVPPEHVAAAVRVRALMATYRENEELVRLGAYKQGTDPEVDTALTAWPQITRFLRQTVEESTPLAESQRLLATLAGVRAAAPPPAAGRRTRRV